MACFRNPFSPKKAPPRKATTISPLQIDAGERAREFGLDYYDGYSRLSDDVNLSFDPETGDWYNENGVQTNRKKQRANNNNNQQMSNKEIQKLQFNNQQLQDENNTLKAKNEILIYMMAEVYSEFKLENDRNAKNKS